MKKVKILLVLILSSNYAFSTAPNWPDFCNKPNNYSDLNEEDFKSFINDALKNNNYIGQCGNQLDAAKNIIDLATKFAVNISSNQIYISLFKNFNKNLRDLIQKNWENYNKMAIEKEYNIISW